MENKIDVFSLVVCGLGLASVGGWVWNIVKLINDTSWEPVTAMGVARALGVLIAPLGAVLGFC